MKKRLLASLMALCLLVGLFPTAAVAAWSGDADGKGTKDNPWVISADDGSNVTAYLTNEIELNAVYGATISLPIPEDSYTLVISGKGNTAEFTTNNQPWTSSKDHIKAIIVEEGVTGLGTNLFHSCSSCIEVSLPSTLTEIESGALAGMGSLEKITLASGNSSFTLDDAGVLYTKDYATLVKYPPAKADEAYSVNAACKTIANTAFHDARNLKSITLPDGLEEIESWALASTKALESIEIPNTVKKIGSSAFNGSGLKNLSFDEDSTLEEIESGAFYNSHLTGELVIPASVKTIGKDGSTYGAFSTIGELTAVSFEEGSQCTYIGTKTFWANNGTSNKSGLTSVSIPASVEEIGDQAFYQQSNLKTITIAGNEKELKIGSQAFAGCSSDANITLGEKDKTTYAEVGSRAFTVGTIYLNSILTGIEESAFYESSSEACTIEGTIIIGRNGTESITIPKNAFRYTTASTIICRPDVISFGQQCFESVTDLNKLVIEAENITVAQSWVNSASIDVVDFTNVKSITGASEASSSNFSFDSDKILIYLNDTDIMNNRFNGTKNIIAMADVNGGTVDITGEDVSSNTLVIPEKEGYTFDGWYTKDGTDDEDWGTKVEEDAALTAGTTYFAKWSPVSEEETAEVLSEEPAESSNEETLDVITEPAEDQITSETTTDVPTSGETVVTDTTSVQPADPTAEELADDETAKKEPVKEDPPSVEEKETTDEQAQAEENVLGMSLTHMAPGNTVYSFYANDKPLGTTANGETTLSYDTTLKGLKIGPNTVTVYAGSDNSGSQVGTITVNLKQKPVTVTGLTAVNRDYNGSTSVALAGGTLNQDDICGNDDVYIGSVSGTVSSASAGTGKPVTVTATLTGDDAGWYTAIASTVTVDIYETSGSSGSSDSDPSYSPILDVSDGGEIKVSPRTPEEDEEVTITVNPDAGYELDELTVTDRNGDEIDVTANRDGTYTFIQPRGRVTIEANFVHTGESGFYFIDVPESAYYYDAVYWAVDEGITNGTTATTFSPNNACTRAQMVTFLWRAAGEPEPETTVNPFTDVSESAYYYDAVLWAVDQGITNGTTATTFSPDATVTRAQTVTFLWRSAGSPAVSGSGFADVASDAYYAGAVAWAVSEGITNGTTATTFSPSSSCTRAQIVTFLYRYIV